MFWFERINDSCERHASRLNFARTYRNYHDFAHQMWYSYCCYMLPIQHILKFFTAKIIKLISLIWKNAVIQIMCIRFHEWKKTFRFFFFIVCCQASHLFYNETPIIPRDHPIESHLFSSSSLPRYPHLRIQCISRKKVL